MSKKYRKLRYFFLASNKPNSKTKYIGLNLIIPILLTLGFSGANGQRIDSLKSLLDERMGNERCDILYQLAYEYIDINNHLGLKYAKLAFMAAKESCDSLRILRAGRIKSLAFRRIGQLDSSMVLSIQMLAIARRHCYDDELIHVLNALALIYTHEAQYDKALKYYFQSLELREKNGSNNEVWITLNNIGLVYYKLEDYDKALTYYEQSLTRKHKEDTEDATTLINMSLCYAYKSNFSVAQNLLDQALGQCRTDCSKDLQMYASFSSGFIAFSLKNLDDAERQFSKSYALAIELDNERYQLDNIFYLSKIFLTTGKIDAAKNLLEDAETLISSGVSYNLGLIQLYSELFNLYRKTGDFEQVSRYQQKYIQLKDSIYSEELTRNLMRVESEYLERENKAKIDAQSQILALNEEIIFRQRILNTFTGIIAVLLAIIIFILFRNNRQKQATNLFLEQKVRERTLELEKKNDALLHTLEQQTVVFQKVSTDIKSFMATIKGLCALGLADAEEAYGGQYIHKIKATSDELLDVVSRILSPKSPR